MDKRKELYKAIMQVRKQIQDKELQELQRKRQRLEQELKGLDSKQRESKLQDLQRGQERQEQRQAGFPKNTAKNLSTNNNVYITKDSYLILV